MRPARRERGSLIFFGQVARWAGVFFLATAGVLRYFFHPLQPHQFLAIIGETATPEQIAVVHRQLDPLPHTFWPWYVHWVRGLYLPEVLVAVVAVSLVSTMLRVSKRTPHDTDPRVSSAALVSGLIVA